MKYENFISYRYLTSSKGQFLSFLNIVSIGGVAIGVMALIVVLGIMTGFGNNLRDKIIGTTPHIVVEKEIGIKDFDTVSQTIAGVEGVKASSPYIQGNVFLETSSGRALGQLVRGVVPETEGNVTKIQEYLKEGNLSDLKDDGVIIGSELARYFGYRIGDEITVISPGSGIEGRGWRYTLKIAGIFNSRCIVPLNTISAIIERLTEFFNNLFIAHIYFIKKKNPLMCS